MTEDNFTQIRVPKEQRERLKVRAEKNLRSVTKEIDYLIEQVEAMEASGIKKVEVIRGPKGSQAVPVVYVQKGEQ